MDSTDAINPPVLSLYRETSDFVVEKGFSYAKVQAHRVAHPHLTLTSDDETELIEKINQYYNIDELVSFLQQQQDGVPKFKRITLQFPDSLICDSATIVHQLQQRLHILANAIQLASVPVDVCGSNSCGTNSCSNSSCNSGDNTDSSAQKIWILADTSYSSCCIDEVAAEHVKSDVVVHFGDACLNVVDKLPAAYVLGKPQLDLVDIIDKFTSKFEKGSKVLLMADAPSTHILGQVYEKLKGEYDLAYADLHLDASSTATILGYSPATSSDAIHLLNRTLLHIQNEEEQDVDSVLSQYELFHIGVPEAPRLLQLTTRFSGVVLYDPQGKCLNEGPYPNLMRRYRYMQVARTSGTIGLLVNTLSLSNTKKLMEKITAKIKEAGKKHYLFVVGKPNVAKLANFENIDMWCILGCDHQGIIIDQYNEYFKPVITPYELLLALNDELSWTGKWVTDFQQVMNDMLDNEAENEPENEPEKDDNDAEASSDEEPEFDPVTGTFVSTSRPLRKLNHIQITGEEHEDASESLENALVKKFASTIAIRNTVSTSASHLQSRHWTGLGSDYATDGADEAGAVVEEGTAGIARGYDFDVSNQQ